MRTGDVYSNLFGIRDYPLVRGSTDTCRGERVKYLRMVYLDETKADALSEEQVQALDAATHACQYALRKIGQRMAAEALQSVPVVTTVRLRRGRVSMTDGPFAETNEQIGGS